MEVDFGKFTPLEREFISHRLAADDAIAECLIETEGQCSYEQYRDTSSFLQGAVALKQTVEVTDIIYDVLVDAVEGAAWLYIAEDMHHADQISKGQLDRRIAAVDTAISKLSSAGISVLTSGQTSSEPLRTGLKI